jgi:putative phosphoesterase
MEDRGLISILHPPPSIPYLLPMLLGILSDTHDRVDAMAEGMRLLRAEKAEFFIHCGDVGSERILDHLAGEKAAFIFGNNDWDKAELRRYAETISVQCLGDSGTVELAGKRIAVTHGDDGPLLNRLLKAQEHDYLLLGHSHIPGEDRMGRTHLINPGALHRARVKTVALLDLATDVVRWIEVRTASK